MISGGWPFVFAAYGVVSIACVGLVVIVGLRLRHWSKQAAGLDKQK